METSDKTQIRILEVLRVEWWNSMSRLASTPERRNGNIDLNKYFISSSGNRTHNQSVLKSSILSHLRADAQKFTIINATVVDSISTQRGEIFNIVISSLSRGVRFCYSTRNA